MDGLALEIYSKLIGKKKRKTLEWSLKTVTIVGTGKSIDFWLFVKVGYYPLSPLACIYIDYYSLHVVVYCHPLSFVLFYIKDNNVQSYGV